MTAICLKCGHAPHDGSCVNVADRYAAPQASSPGEPDEGLSKFVIAFIDGQTRTVGESTLMRAQVAAAAWRAAEGASSEGELTVDASQCITLRRSELEAKLAKPTAGPTAGVNSVHAQYWRDLTEHCFGGGAYAAPNAYECMVKVVDRAAPPAPVSRAEPNDGADDESGEFTLDDIERTASCCSEFFGSRLRFLINKVRALKIATSASNEPEAASRAEHQWSEDGEKCVRCGSPDWCAGESCSAGDERMSAAFEDAMRAALAARPDQSAATIWVKALAFAERCAQSAPNEGGSEPVARVGGLHEDDMPHTVWLRPSAVMPGDLLYAAPAPVASPAALTGHEAESLRMIAGWLDRDGTPEPAAFLRGLAVRLAASQAEKGESHVE